MQSCLFSFVLCLIPSAFLVYIHYDYSVGRGFLLYTLCLAALLTAILRLWLQVTELEKRVRMLERQKTDGADKEENQR